MNLGGLSDRPLELRELRYFHAVAITGNFHRAARELRVEQPAVTRQVQKLERALGTQLLLRHGRGITLTAAGSSLKDRLDIIMGLLSAPISPDPAPAQTTGRMTVALPPEIVPLVFPRLFEAAQARLPKITLAIREGTSSLLEEWLLGRRVELAVLQDPSTPTDLVVESVLIENLGLVSSVRTLQFDRRDSVKLRELADLKLILPNPGHWIHRQVANAAFRRGVVLDVLQLDGLPLIKEMVRHGYGHAALPYGAVREEVNRGALAFLPIEQDTISTVHAIAGHRAVAHERFILEVRLMLQNVMVNLVQSGIWAGEIITRRTTDHPRADAPSQS